MKTHRLALVSLLLFACKSDPKGPPAEATKSAEEAEASPPAAQATSGSRTEAIANAPTPLAPGMTRLEALGLQIELPPGSKLPPPNGAIHDLILPNSVFVTVKEVDQTAPKTMDDAQSFAAAYSPSSMKTETLPDGWVLEFESDAAGGKSLWIQVRRKFADKSYECSGNAFRPEDRAPIVAACKSLKR